MCNTKKEAELLMNIKCKICKEPIAKKGEIFPYGLTTIYCSKSHGTDLIIKRLPRDI